MREKLLLLSEAPVLGRSEVLLAIVNSGIVVVDPLIECGIQELLVDPGAELELCVFCLLEILAEDRNGLKGLPQKLHSIELIGLEPLSDELLFALDHGSDFD